MENVIIQRVNVIVKRVGEVKIATRRSAVKIVIIMAFAKLGNVYATTDSRENIVKNQFARITAIIEVYATRGSAIV
jgi:hypothetical protein